MMNYFSQINYLLSRVIQRLSFWGVIAVALSLLSIIIYITQVPTLSETIKLAEQALLSAKASIHHQQDAQKIEVVAELPKQNDAKSLAQFYQQIPITVDVPKILNQINKTATQYGLKLNHGDYKLTKKPMSNILPMILRYEIVLPVTGSYVQIRQFMDDVLAQQAALAIHDVQIKRENSTSSLVEARLVWVLFVKAESL